MSQKVTIYRTGWCPFCQRAEALLATKSLAELEVIDLDDRPDQRPVMVERAGRTSVPPIFVGDRHLGGCDDLMALERNGRLDPILRGEA